AVGRIGGYAEHSFTEIRQFSGNVGKIIDPVFHVCIEASVGLRHDDGQAQFFRVSLQGGVPLPYAVVVGAAVKQIENRRRFCIPGTSGGKWNIACYRWLLDNKRSK